MIRKSFRYACILFMILTIGCAGGSVGKRSDCSNIDSIKKVIRDKSNDIQSYQLDATVKMDGHAIFSEISGQPPDRLKVVQHVKQAPEPMQTTVVFDGKHQWVESKTSRKTQLLKIRSSELVSKKRPFDTGFYLMGTGLINGEDFPSTIKTLLSIYNLSSNCISGNVVLSGSLDPIKFNEYASKRRFRKTFPLFIEKFKKRFGFVKITFSNPDYNIQGYSMGSSNSNETITVSFRNIAFNLAGIEAILDFQAPDGIQAVDITNNIRQALADDRKLFDAIISKEILMGKNVQGNLFSLEAYQEGDIKRYVFEFKFKKTRPIQHYICALSVAKAGVFIDSEHYHDAYRRHEKDYIKTNPGQWKRLLHHKYPEIGRRAQYGPVSAGPGGAAYDLSITTTDGQYDIKITISNLMPDTVEGPNLDIEQIAKTISDRYNLAVKTNEQDVQQQPIPLQNNKSKRSPK